MSKIPVACDLTAIDKSEWPNHNKNTLVLFSSVCEVKELQDGFGLKLPAETDIVKKAGAFISLERLCCPFFNFSLEVTPGHGPVWLKLTGPDEVKSFVKEHIVSQLDHLN